MHPEIAQKIRLEGIKPFARRCGVPEGSIRALIQGIASGAKHAAKIADAVGCTVHDVTAGRRILTKRNVRAGIEVRCVIEARTFSAAKASAVRGRVTIWRGKAKLDEKGVIEAQNIKDMAKQVKAIAEGWVA